MLSQFLKQNTSHNGILAEEESNNEDYNFEEAQESREQSKQNTPVQAAGNFFINIY